MIKCIFIILLLYDNKTIKLQTITYYFIIYKICNRILILIIVIFLWNKRTDAPTLLIEYTFKTILYQEIIKLGQVSKWYNGL